LGTSSTSIEVVFLHGNLAKKVYTEQPLEFVVKGEFGLVCATLFMVSTNPHLLGLENLATLTFRLKCSETYHSIFHRHTSPRICVYLIVYFDGIIITGNNVARKSQLKHFQTKDLESLKYFLGIEVSESKEGVVIS